MDSHTLHTSPQGLSSAQQPASMAENAVSFFPPTLMSTHSPEQIEAFRSLMLELFPQLGGSLLQESDQPTSASPPFHSHQDWLAYIDYSFSTLAQWAGKPVMNIQVVRHWIELQEMLLEGDLVKVNSKRDSPRWWKQLEMAMDRHPYCTNLGGRKGLWLIDFSSGAV